MSTKREPRVRNVDASSDRRGPVDPSAEAIVRRGRAYATYCQAVCYSKFILGVYDVLAAELPAGTSTELCLAHAERRTRRSGLRHEQVFNDWILDGMPPIEPLVRRYCGPPTISGQAEPPGRPKGT